jgi:hypothetical protein
MNDSVMITLGIADHGVKNRTGTFQIQSGWPNHSVLAFVGEPHQILLLVIRKWFLLHVFWLCSSC